MYSLNITSSFLDELPKISKNNKKHVEIIFKKSKEIVRNPNRYKNLKSPLNHWKRVHINGSFVLAFSIDKNTKTVYLEAFDHHDNIYKHKSL